MTKAHARANQYFWDKLEKVTGVPRRLPEYITQLYKPSKTVNVMLSSNSVSFCQYQPVGADEFLISIEDLKAIINFANKKNYFINFIFPCAEIPESYWELIISHNYRNVIYYDEQQRAFQSLDRALLVMNIDQEFNSDMKVNVAVVHLNKNNLKDMAIKLKRFFERINRINVILHDTASFGEEDFDSYKSELFSLSRIMIQMFTNGKMKECNLLTDRIFLEKMNNCDAGEKHLTFGPDGKFYLCPAFYYIERSVGDIATGIKIQDKHLLKLENAPICRNCDAYQCRRCFFENWQRTYETNVPGKNQCIVSHIEREVSRQLQEELIELGILQKLMKKIPELDYYDPFEIITKTRSQQTPRISIPIEKSL
jgi:CXXX repeat peptide maturase